MLQQHAKTTLKRLDRLGPLALSFRIVGNVVACVSKSLSHICFVVLLPLAGSVIVSLLALPVPSSSPGGLAGLVIPHEAGVCPILI